MSVIAVTGASGYIGGRLVPLLLENGHEVRVLTRRKDALRDVPWRAEVEVIEGDLTDLQSAQELCRGASVLYYLVHSMGGNSDFAPLEEHCARTIVQAARQPGPKASNASFTFRGCTPTGNSAATCPRGSRWGKSWRPAASPP